MTRFVPLLLLVLTCSLAFAADETARGIWTASDQPLNTDVTSVVLARRCGDLYGFESIRQARSQVPHRDSHPLDATELVFPVRLPLTKIFI